MEFPHKDMLDQITLIENIRNGKQDPPDGGMELSPEAMAACFVGNLMQGKIDPIEAMDWLIGIQEAVYLSGYEACERGDDKPEFDFDNP